MALRTTAARKMTRLPDQPSPATSSTFRVKTACHTTVRSGCSRKNSPHPPRPSPNPIKRIKNPFTPGTRRHHLGTAPPNKKSSPQPTTIKTFTTHRHRHRCRRHHNRRPRRQQLLLHGQSRINRRTRLRGPRQPHRHPVHPASKPIVHRDHGHTRHPIHRR